MSLIFGAEVGGPAHVNSTAAWVLYSRDQNEVAH